MNIYHHYSYCTYLEQNGFIALEHFELTENALCFLTGLNVHINKKHQNGTCSMVRPYVGRFTILWQVLTFCSGEAYFDLQNVLLLVSLLFSFHLPSCSRTPAFFHSFSSISLSLRAALGMPWGDGSLAPQLCGCRTGAVTLSPASALCLCQSCQRSALGTKKKKRVAQKEGGVDIWAGRGWDGQSERWRPDEGNE